MTRSYYLTARCPLGCQSWLHPRWMRRHLESGRCRRRPWVDALVDQAVVPEPAASVFAALLPSDLVAPIEFNGDVDGRTSLTDGDTSTRALLVRSPLPQVRARRWAYVALGALERDGGDGLATALEPEGFASLARELALDLWLVDCPHCGEAVTRSGLAAHRAKNRVCHWRRAAATVRELWADGWRDPWSTAGVPLEWETLRRSARWRGRLRSVTFPRWAAVLVEVQ